MKVCRSCLLSKDLKCFSKHINTIDGLKNICKSCNSENIRKQRQLKREQIASRTEKKCSGCGEIKPLICFSYSKYSVDGHLGKCNECLKEERNTDEYRLKRRNYRSRNKEKQNETQRKWYHETVQNEPWRRLRKSVSKAIRCGLKRLNGSKHGESIFKYLPYTVEQLKGYLESLWEPWMSWDNYGKHDWSRKTWQIDHIIPQSALPFSDMNDENFQKLWALSNLRPLETIANIRKSNKIMAA